MPVWSLTLSLKLTNIYNHITIMRTRSIDIQMYMVVIGISWSNQCKFTIMTGCGQVRNGAG